MCSDLGYLIVYHPQDLATLKMRLTSRLQSKKDAKEYIENVFKMVNIKRSMSPYGVPLFFVIEKDKSRGVINYRALNIIKKRNNDPIPMTDKIFDRVENAKVFSKKRFKKIGFIKSELNLKILKRRHSIEIMVGLNILSCQWGTVMHQ